VQQQRSYKARPIAAGKGDDLTVRSAGTPPAWQPTVQSVLRHRFSLMGRLDCPAEN
jgi:hypothetical protein